MILSIFDKVLLPVPYIRRLNNSVNMETKEKVFIGKTVQSCWCLIIHGVLYELLPSGRVSISNEFNRNDLLKYTWMAIQSESLFIHQSDSKIEKHAKRFSGDGKDFIKYLLTFACNISTEQAEMIYKVTSNYF